MTHEIKILPKYFCAVMNGTKNFEIRKNDRDYKIGDTLILKEWDRGKFTGRELEREVGYIYYGDGTCGLSENYCVMALKRGKPCVLDYADQISRQAAIDAIKRCDSADSYDLNNGLILAMNAVADVPTIDPVKHGEWITKKDECGIDYQICSNCETEIQWRNRHGVIMRVDMQNLPYCPNCGARIEREA